MNGRTIVKFGCCWLGMLPAAVLPCKAEPPRPTEVRGLISFWDFAEEAGKERVAQGQAYKLREMQGPIARAEDGVFGKHSAELKEGQWFRIPREECPALDLHGKEARVSVVAWVKRGAKKSAWQAVAGLWDESRGKRQYCLFLDAARRTKSTDLTRDPCRDLIHGHVSAVGGPTPGDKFCITYASGATKVPLDAWHAVAMTYDGKHSRVYLDGKLDAVEPYNPFPYADGLYDAGPTGADFTVGSVSVGGKPGNFFVGRLGGLAIYDRALSDEELASLCAPRKVPEKP